MALSAFTSTSSNFLINNYSYNKTAYSKIVIIAVILFFISYSIPDTFSQTPSLTITEVFPDPKAVGDSEGEWFELYNPGDQQVNLKGALLKDDGRDSHIIESDVTISPKSYLVFCRNGNSEENGGVSCAYQYSKFSLANESDEIIIENAGELAKLVYSKSSHSFSSGKSMELEGSNWHTATSQFGKGDYGTPGTGNSPAATPTTPPVPTNTSTPKPTKTPTHMPTKVEPTSTSFPTIKQVLSEENENVAANNEFITSIYPRGTAPIVQEARVTQGEILGETSDTKSGTSKIFFTAGLATLLLSVATAFYIHSRG